MGASSYTPDPGYGALFQKLAGPPNPLTTVGQDAQAIDQVKQFQAKNALSNIYQQSIDPQTGQVDLGKFNALASQNPAALYNFGESMHSAGAGLQAQGVGTSAQLSARLDQLGAQAAYMSPLVAKAQQGTVTADDIRNALKDIPPGVIPPSTLANINQQLADGADPNNVVRGAFFANENGRAMLNSALGPIATVNQGPYTSFVRQPPFAPGGVASPVPMDLTPDQRVAISKALTQQTTWTDPNDPTKTRTGPESERLKELYGIDPNTLLKAFPGVGAEPPIPGGTTQGGENREIQTNNFAGMRNPNVPAAGGPQTNPQGWQTFATPEAGIQAISNQLDRYASGATTGKPLNTLNGIISTWAPASDGNPTQALIARGARIMGVSPDQPLDLSDPNVKAKLVEVMIRNEQGGNLPQKAAAAIPGALNAPNWRPFGTVQPAPAPSPPAANLVPGGGAQVPVPNIQLADFPAGRVVGAPTTLPETTKASGQDYATDLAQYKDLPARLSMLTQSADILRANPNLGTGTGAGDIQRLASLAQNFGFTLSPQANTNLAAFTELNKDLERYYLSRPGSQRSDLAQAETKMSQPSTEMQRDALQDLIGKTIGLERFNSAPYLNFAQQHGPANAAMYAPQYEAEAAAYKNTLDQNAFGFDYMTPQERAAYRDSLTPAGKQRYYYSLKEASRLYGVPLQ